MASQRIKGITIEIGGNTSQLVSALHDVDKAAQNTKYNISDLNKALKLDPTNVNLLKDKQNELKDAVNNAKEKLDLEKQALADLEKQDGFDKNSKQAKDLQTQIDLDTVALKEAEKQLQSFGTVGGQVLQSVGKELKEVGERLKEVGDRVKEVGQNLTTHLTVPIATAFAGSAKAAIDWESAFTGVMKTVDETATTTYDDLKNDINEIAKTTASSQNQIAATMEIAGQLGVSADNIAEFTKTMIMLGDTTNLSSEEAASAIAKFANVTKMPLTEVDKLGSAIVDLGNNYATTEADIVSMATRLSGAGAQIGLSQGEILGFATALSSVGIEAEMGGSAFSKAMIKMQVAAESGASGFAEFQAKLAEIEPDYATYTFRDIQVWLTNDSKALKELATATGYTKKEVMALIESRANLENFAEVAGMTSDEFVQAYEKDAPAALQAFIKGLGDTEGKGESTIQMLQDMGFTEVRLRDTLTRLAQSGDLVTDAVARGNEAFDANNAMSAEAEKRYATMETKLQQLKNSLTEVAVNIGEILMPYIQQGVEYISQLLEKWNSLDESQQKSIITIAAIAAAIGPALIVIGQVVSTVGTIVSAVGSLTTLLGSLSGVLATLSAPLVAVVAAVAALAAGFVYLYQTNEEFRNKINELVAGIKENFSSMIETIKPAFEELFGTVKQIIGEVVDGFKKFIEEGKPVFEFIATGIAGVINGVMAAATPIVNTINSVIKTVVEVVKAMFALFTGDFKSFQEHVKNALINLLDVVKNLLTAKLSFFKGLFSTFGADIVSNAMQWGIDMINNLINGIQSMIGRVGDAIQSVADVISSYIHFSEPDVGPLKNFNTFMPDMMRQLAQGINKGIPQVEDALNRLTSNMANDMQPNMGTVGANMAAGGVSNTTNTNTVNINVYGAQGQDVNELANKVQDIINNQIYSKGAVFA